MLLLTLTHCADTAHHPQGKGTTTYSYRILLICLPVCDTKNKQICQSLLTLHSSIDFQVLNFFWSFYSICSLY